ncbi:dGTPase [Alteromonas macleodii]|uniref:Putative deoxyguanosinetriphosphate triphosphohydrolase n=1 Tax=Alteromonas macleodii TaxID=28108 RepID=A0A6T9Y6A2_ALTMA|nr:dGTPase [Alteromonas macleodii]CAB9495841.1 putative deoxyguanosinetriphosphate triphosphohydrolase [Alteromonas macleodii]
MSGFSSKISHKRFHASREMTNNASFPCELSGNDRESMCNAITFQCESDRGRIINSAAVRRLQQKTQVFPLERNAAVRSRLTHSLEVMQVGRFITRKLISKMQRLDSHKSDIEGLEDALESIVEMSCLMHDVGNPPFGHFGERAIQDWLSSNLGDCIRVAFEDKTNAHESTYVPEDLIKDIIGFEGNAQGIRIITNLQKLNLTKTQIASVLKYTRCGTEERPSDEQHPQYYLLKKVGYYFSEKSIVEEVVSFHGLANRHRHPIAYIMEAADDISYCIADLEDAVDKGLLTMHSLKELLLNEYTNLRPDCDRMARILGSNQSWSRYDAKDVSQFFIAFRSNFVVALVSYAADVIFNNLSAILEGSYGGHILEDNSPESCMAKAMKNVAFSYVFNHPEVEANELKGYTVITGLLEKYKPLLEAPQQTFIEALNNSKDVPVFLSRLCKKLPAKHLRAYNETMENGTGNSGSFPNTKVMEYYYRCRLIQDLISGMTDQYALDEYRQLMAVDAV